jgi:two-component system sensor histidine kinase and response regulator WspE
MTGANSGELADLSLLELFRVEVETQTALLTEGVLALERGAHPVERTRELMRVAHSLKGAARIVGRDCAVRISHAMEECLVSFQAKGRPLSQELIDTLLQSVDMLGSIARVTDEGFDAWEKTQERSIDALLNRLASPEASIAPVAVRGEPVNTPEPEPSETAARLSSDRMLRVTAGNLSRLMAVAGEALVATRWLESFTASMLRMKHLQQELGHSLEALRDLLPGASLSDEAARQLARAHDRNISCQTFLAERMSELDLFDRRLVSVSKRLYDEVLDCRMRPFSDGIEGFPRMVRDMANALGKSVKFEIVGEGTLVDREILEKLKPTINHLLRNALDHGIEAHDDRLKSDKPEEGRVRLEACHSAGILLVTVSDDGKGIDPEGIRQAVIGKRLTTPELGQKLSDAELLEFLFLPGFTLKSSVSEISGRGVGLDAVQMMAREVGGRVRISSRKDHGTRFEIDLPLTLSVVRTLLVEISGEPYAIPLARINKVLKLNRSCIESVEQRQHFTLEGQQIGLVAAYQVLDLVAPGPRGVDVAVVILGEKDARYGLVVDNFLGQVELVVRPLDPRLGKVRDISSSALMSDGRPVLIIDADDLNSSIANLISGKTLSRMGFDKDAPTKRKRVLVADDSLTVRELERKLLEGGGYEVDVVVDGMDAWNAVRTGGYDLVVTDVDMPRMDGIELLKLIRGDNRLKSLPAMIVSYKDRPEDRNRGLEAGADYYLTKASFHDRTLLSAVADLIGGVEA